MNTKWPAATNKLMYGKRWRLFPVAKKKEEEEAETWLTTLMCAFMGLKLC